MILVTGATGQLGSAVVRQLLARTDASEIAVLARDPGKAADLEKQGVSVRAGDYDDTGSLARAAGNRPRPADRVERLPAAAAAAPERDRRRKGRRHQAAGLHQPLARGHDELPSYGGLRKQHPAHAAKYLDNARCVSPARRRSPSWWPARTCECR
jgi:hypothetical protein